MALVLPFLCALAKPPPAACGIRDTACADEQKLPFPLFGNYPGEGTNSSAWVRYSLPGALRTPAPPPYADDFRLEQIPEDTLSEPDNARAFNTKTGRNNGWNKGEQIGHHRLYSFFFEGTAPTFGLTVYRTWGSTGGLRRFDFAVHEAPVPKESVIESVVRLRHPEVCIDRPADNGTEWKAPAGLGGLLDPETSPVASVIVQGNPQPISLTRFKQMDIKYSYKSRATPETPRSVFPPTSPFPFFSPPLPPRYPPPPPNRHADSWKHPFCPLPPPFR